MRMRACGAALALVEPFHKPLQLACTHANPTCTCTQLPCVDHHSPLHLSRLPRAASCTQQLHWNCPVQLAGGGGGCEPAAAAAAAACDEALRCAEGLNFEVEPGDVLVIGAPSLERIALA